MITNNIIQLRTKIIFGPDALTELPATLKSRQLKRILVVMGGGSVHKNGAYADTVAALSAAKVKHFEYSGVKPNPEAQHTYAGAQFAIKNKVDAVLALGGGSVCDAAKVMAILATNPQYKDAWSYVDNPKRVKHDALPVIAVMTTAGTASENNAGSVITNPETKEKRGVQTPSAVPFAAFLNPVYTYSISPWHTASGIFDCFSHLLEQYYGLPQFEWTRQYILAHLRTLIKYGPIAVNEPKNYEARANVMITTTMALNGIASFASKTDWKVHSMEHAISALWDVTHGAGLALLTPTYLKQRCKTSAPFKKQTEELAHELFDLKNKTADSFIRAVQAFIQKLGLPKKLTDFAEIKTVSKQDRDYLYHHVVNSPNHGRVFAPEEMAAMHEVLKTLPA